MLFQSEKNIKEYGEKITQDEKNSLNEVIDKLKQAHTIKDVSLVEKLTEELNTKWNTISTRMYSGQNQGQDEPQKESQQNNSPKDDILDVDYTEIK